MISPEHMRTAHTDHSVAWMEFLQNKDENVTFCFVEGEEDLLYYEPRVHHRFPTHSYRMASCGGKRGVLRLRALVQEQSKNSKCMYFVDLDFDNPLGDPEVFETSCHSIENLYCTEESFTRIMTTEFRLSPTGSDFAKAMLLYSTRRQEFHDCATAVNAWIAVAVRRGDAAKLNLSNVKIDSFVDVTLGRVSPKPCLTNVSELFPDCKGVTPEEFADQLDAFSTVDAAQTFRGKFELQFLIKMLRLIKGDVTSQSPQTFSQRYKVLLNISDNSLSELSQYATTPDSLVAYIERKYNQFYAAS